MKRRKAAYWTDAAQWIADNDDPSDMDALAIAGTVTVLMVADIFGKSADEIAKHIVTLRAIQTKPTDEVQHLRRVIA